VRIRDYSEKAFVVLGNTFSKKDILKGLGGKWNAKLVCRASAPLDARCP
jgi:hypothetical protein